MPLSRSNTSRSKSRSPAPPSPSPRPLAFLPPSHYAAAGGFSLPERSQSGSFSAGNYSDSPPFQSQDTYMPVSSNKHASSSISISGETGRKRRESQIQNLPFLETQLLPSLRDTIDKMTRPPSRMNNPSSNSNSCSTPTFKFQSSEEDGSISPYLSTQLKAPSAFYALDDRPTTPKQISTQKAGVLKSALKPSTPKISSSSLKSESASPTLATSSPGGGALKSVRSLLRRKSSASTVPIPSSDQSTKENQPMILGSFSVNRQMNTRSRSRTDPGTLPLKDTSYTLSTPITPQPPSKLYQASHIPRFRRAGSGTKLATAGARRFVPNGISTDESDFEYRYEVEGRIRRKLTVANAEVVASSSSSEAESSDVDLYQHRQYGYGQTQRLPGLPVKAQVRGQEGTGLIFTESCHGYPHGDDYHDDHHFVVEEKTKAHSSALEPDRHFSVASYPSAGSIYTDNDEEDSELERSSVSLSGNGPSFNQNIERFDGASNTNQSFVLDELGETHARRKAALLGLVCGLQNEQDQSQINTDEHRSASESSILSEGESDYCGERGLAVSGSLDAQSGSSLQSTQAPDSRSDDEFESGYGFFANDGTVDQRKGLRSSVSSTTSTPRTPAAPPPPISGIIRKSSSYYLKSPEVTGSKRNSDSKRYTLHTSSPPPFVGPNDHLPQSPCLPSSVGQCPNDGHRSSRLPQFQARSTEEADNREQREDRKATPRRKAYNNDRDSSPATNSSRTVATKFSSSLAPPSPLLSSSSPSPDKDLPDYETVVLSKRSRETVMRTRKAFGIPPSESEEIYHCDTTGDRNRESSGLVSKLTPADSMASDVNVAMDRDSWEHEGENELSVGAENLFRTLNLCESGDEVRGRSHHIHEGRKSQQQSGLLEDKRNDKSTARECRQSRRRSRTPIGRHKSTQRTPPLSDQQENLKYSFPAPPSSWFSIVDLNTYRSLLESHGETEILRQEVIWELRFAETAFVQHLSSVVNLFILPLRVHASKTWIAGVPLEISKTLDWLEDIINLHTQIRDTLQSFQTPESPFARAALNEKGGVANALRAYVPKLEIYQPYLVKIAGVLEILGRLVRDEESDFGEFVRIQEATADSQASLASMLLEPVNRLASYPELFRKLLEVTGKTHNEYLSTLMLVHSTALVVKTLMAIKTREEEYELIKRISERIDGLPSAINLARRERRLLCHGQLLRMDSRHYLPTKQHSDQLESNHLNKSPNPLNKMSRLVDAINEWDTSRRSRSGSLKSNTSTSTGVSFRSVETSSPPPSPHILVLVFSDLVIFATTRARTQEQQGTARWSVCEDIGVARVLGVKDEALDKDSQDVDALSIIVDLLPVQLDFSQCVKTLQLKLPPLSSAATSYPSRESWLAAFRCSSRSTLRILSDPSISRSSNNLEEPNHLLEQDRRRILESILESGLPLPKSPSLQLADKSIGLGKSGDCTQVMEREERGWWSLQFQELLRESWYGLASLS